FSHSATSPVARGYRTTGSSYRVARPSSVVDAADQLRALEHLDLDPAEPHVEAGLMRVQHLVALLDPVRLRADGGDDPGADGDGVQRRGGQDQAGARLGLVAYGLDDDVLVERLERRIDVLRLIQHAQSIGHEWESKPSGIDDPLQELLGALLAGGAEDL